MKEEESPFQGLFTGTKRTYHIWYIAQHQTGNCAGLSILHFHYFILSSMRFFLFFRVASASMLCGSWSSFPSFRGITKAHDVIRVAYSFFAFVYGLRLNDNDLIINTVFW